MANDARPKSSRSAGIFRLLDESLLVGTSGADLEWEYAPGIFPSIYFMGLTL